MISSILFMFIKMALLFFVMASYVVVGLAMVKINKHSVEPQLLKSEEPFSYWVVMCFLFIASPFVLIYSWLIKPELPKE